MKHGHTNVKDLPLLAATLLASILLGGPAPADEGMWLFNQLPLDQLRSRYGFTADPGWAEHVMRSCVRLSSGGSGSFVSAQGLILTNHHVGSDALQKLSTEGRNLLRDGFLAKTLEEELACPDMEVLSLVEIEDVTARVNAAVPKGADPAAAGKARREATAVIEKESHDATGLKSEVVTLYQGGQYHLYRYRRYADVRLVMAPETDIAFFGGDVDNFEYPRHCLDVCFFRAYEDGKPARIEQFLRWSADGAREGDLIFVAGHPGSTRRLNTLDHFRFLRDVEYPWSLEVLARREIALQQFAIRGAEQELMVRDEMFYVQNSRKARLGGVAGLLDPVVLLDKARAEAELRGMAATDAGLGASQEDWSRIAASRQAFSEFYLEYQLLENQRGFWSVLFDHARVLVRLAEEKEKPNEERLPGFRETDMDSLDQMLYSPAPVYVAAEKVKLSDSLTLLASRMGGEHPLVQLALAGRSPIDRAHDLVSGTKLIHVEERRKVAAGGKRAIAESTDPMIILARSVDPYARGVRRKYEDLVQGVERESYSHITAALFRLRGTAVYPDATFTLRLAFGAVKGYVEGGAEVAPFTSLGQAYAKHESHQGKEPFRLPQSWLDARDKIDLSLPFNFVSTADIIGGNSGSPVLNRRGEFVGIIFDGNIQSLVLDFYYTEEQARALAVASPAIIESLGKIYGATDLVGEILGR